MLRFRLRSLLLIALALCGVLAWSTRYRGWMAEAELRVEGRHATRVSFSGSRDPTCSPHVIPADLPEWKDRILDSGSTTWDSVIDMSLSNPVLSGNRILETVEDPRDWVQQNVTVEFNGKSRTILLRMRCRATWSTDASLLLETIADVLADHLTSQDRRTRYNARKYVESSLSLIRESVLLDESKYDRLERDPTIGEPLRTEALAYRREQIEDLADAEARLLEVLEQIKVEEANPLEVRRTGPAKVKRTW